MTRSTPLTPERVDTTWALPMPLLMGWTCEEARWERLGYRYGDGDHHTPWARGWRRDIYERVVGRFWVQLTDGLGPVRPDGRLLGQTLLDRLPPTAVEFAARTPLDEQERFLAAMWVPFEEAIGPVEPYCRCRYCAAARQLVDRLPPRETLLRLDFAAHLARHVELLLRAPNRYDRAHGAPRALWRARATTAHPTASDSNDAAEGLTRAAA